MEKTKTVRMPAGIRNKLMAAIAMLLVSSIMMVSSTYAWFTLSTAPEVTGITTSVGANGNLEIALLTSETYKDPTEIGSAVGNSSAYTKDVTQSNITWGNLVDLSDARYGLNLIALNPAAPNYATTQGEGDTLVLDPSKITTSSLLMTAVYGPDGRVAELEDNTVSGIYNSTTSKWVTTETITKTDDTTEELAAHGVRAIGVDSNMTTAEIVLNAAQSAVSSGKNGASAAVTNAVNAHKTTFLSLATSLQQESKTSYTPDELAALKAVAEGVKTSLESIVKVYSNAVLAKLASNVNTSEEVLSLVRPQLSNTTQAADLLTLMNTAGVTDTTYTTRLDALKDDQASVAAILGKFTVTDGVVGTITEDGEGNPVTVDVKTEIVTPLIGNKDSVIAFDQNDEPMTITKENALTVGRLYLTDCLVAEVAEDTGTYLMITVLDTSVYAGSNEEAAATGYLEEIATSVEALDPPAGGNAEKTIADFYGYVIDFAFRTNAASSNLQLQTTPANRVYSNAEGDNLATQGAGSTATFAYDTEMKEEQVSALLNAVKLVFLDPDQGTVHATASLTGIDFDTAAYIATANVELDEKDEQDGDAVTIVALPQNTPTKVSVLVYLDGEQVDNADVSTKASSGMLNLNLQFSSSANLTPMENTALKNMVITYDELSDNDYKAGLYTYNGTVYTVKRGYKLYEGSDGMIYYSTDAATYTKLSAINVSSALETLKITFTGESLIKAGETMNLSLTSGKGTVQKVVWSSADPAVATVPADDVKTDAAVVVTGAGAGSTKINAAVELLITYDETVEGTTTQKEYTKTVNVAYPVTVTAADTGNTDTDDTGNGDAGTGDTEGTTYNVTVPTGVTGEATVAEGDSYTFSVAETTSVSVTIAGNDDFALAAGTTDAGVTTYTIDSTEITGDIVITVNS